MHPVKRLRAEQRLSIRDLEARSGVPKGTISGIERGIRDPHALTLAKLADGLGVSVDELDPKASAPKKSGRTEAEFQAAIWEMRRTLKELSDPENRRRFERLSRPLEEAQRMLDEIDAEQQGRSA